MKFCGNCGTQLADDAIFCDECGTRIEEATAVQAELEETPQIETHTENIVHDVEPKLKEIKLSDTCKPAKRQMKGWLLVLLLVVFSPSVFALIIDAILFFLPFGLMLILLLGTSLWMLILTWRRQTWKAWIKILITIVYVLMYFI